ncbi:DUF423 domain-containing protein [Reichenbachiella sp. 5M10]|uniref:DUF423 domain-containing protein n=1 Tax=Reichenbachiella sp. 5M10 TaxID=1889772 RepID=UPI002100AC08|nr:DUF423 domain-containing protein [Reichenbachiella sp. 5M10]
MAILTIVIGAFGAHGLQFVLEANDSVAIFETAVRYQGTHALGILILGVMTAEFDRKWLKLAEVFFLTGILFFSGSLYVLSVTGMKFLGAITPIGGVCLIAGWVMMITSLKKKKS